MFVASVVSDLDVASAAVLFHQRLDGQEEASSIDPRGTIIEEMQLLAPYQDI